MKFDPQRDPWYQLTTEQRLLVSNYREAEQRWTFAQPPDDEDLAPTTRQHYGNPAENKCYRQLLRMGVTALKKGYPDFWLEYQGKLIFIEVKPRPWHRLKGMQDAFLTASAKLGVYSYRYAPRCGFLPIGHSTPISQILPKGTTRQVIDDPSLVLSV